MPLNIKLLANGQLSNSVGDIYTVPGSTRAIIKTMTFVNNTSSDQTINIFILPSGGTARKIIGGVLLADGGYCICDSEFTLGAGDKVRGSSTNANVVDYTISGVEEV